jgi:integrase
LPAVEDGATVRTIVFFALAELIHPAKLIFRVAVAVRRGIDEPRHGLGIIGLYAELKASAISELIKETSGQEQALYVLLAATGMRVSEARAVEIPHFTNDGRTINVEQQVKKDSSQIAKYLLIKSAAAKRQVDLHPDIAEYLRRYAAGKSGLLSIPRTAGHIYTATWRIAGLRLASSVLRLQSRGSACRAILLFTEIWRAAWSQCRLKRGPRPS